MLQQKTTSRTTARLPVVTDDHGAVETFQLAGTYSRQAAADVAEEYDIADSDALICKIVFAMFVMGMLVSTAGGVPLTMSVPVLGTASVTLFLLTLYC